MGGTGRSPRRRTLRRKGYDYTTAGAYLVTVVVRDRAPVLGKVHEGVVLLTEVGQIVADTWAAIEDRFPEVGVDTHVVMPDHIHAIVWIDCDAWISLGRVVGTFKGLSARRVHAAWGRVGGAFWQRGYHDHVIRNTLDLARCRQYITDNPRQWVP